VLETRGNDQGQYDRVHGKGNKVKSHRTHDKSDEQSHLQYGTVDYDSRSMAGPAYLDIEGEKEPQTDDAKVAP
jgi:hypothetical protein